MYILHAPLFQGHVFVTSCRQLCSNHTLYDRYMLATGDWHLQPVLTRLAEMDKVMRPLVAVPCISLLFMRALSAFWSQWGNEPK